MQINKIYNENCLETMAKMPDCFVDLVVTSPPYDNLREYKGFSFPFEDISKELFRITKDGGVLVWVVGDSTVKGCESLTSFKQAIYFVEQCGFNLHDTMFYVKNAMPFPESNRYNNCVEYMFVFSKGSPKTFNPIKEKTSDASRKRNGSSSNRLADGKMSKMKYETGKYERNRFNFWNYGVGFAKTTNDKIAFQHPAMFPEKLVKEHIYSWSNEGDLIYDCFSGSGTTAKMAHLQKRKWIGSEISKEYCDLAEKRIAPYLSQTSLF
jgi:site-specific DNA-methyltransferase (adenine-specific)